MNYPPFEFLNEKGIIEGFDVDLLHSVANEIGITIDLIPMQWSLALEAVQSGKYDAILGMFVNSERQEKFLFSDEYLSVPQGIFVSSKHTNIKDFSDLVGLSVAIQKNALADELMKNRLAKYGESFELILIQDQIDGLTMLLDGEVDAFIGNRLTGIYLLQQLSRKNDINIVEGSIDSRPYAVAFNKDKKDLVNLFNYALEKIRNNGSYKEIYTKWYGYNTNAFDTQIIENIGIGVISFNKFGQVVSANSYAREFFSSKNLIRNYYTEPPICECIEPVIIASALKNGQTFLDKEVNVRYKGKDIILKYNITPLYDSHNSISGVVVSLMDFTQEKKMQESLIMRDKMQSLGTLLASFAHEIRNPLTAIKSFTEALPYQYNNEEYRENLLYHIPKEINRLDKLITELLEYSRPRKGIQKWYNIKNCIESVTNLIQYYQQKYKRKILINIPDDICFFVSEQQIKQVLLNLILNAIESTDKDGVIEISAIVEEDIIINIRDNGCGIKEEDYSQLFDPFFTTKQGGTGLGLFIVYHLLKENHGDIQILSKEGKGTSISLIFPRKEE